MALLFLKRRDKDLPIFISSFLISLGLLFFVLWPTCPELSDKKSPQLLVEDLRDGNCYKDDFVFRVKVIDGQTEVAWLSVEVDGSPVWQKQFKNSEVDETITIVTQSLSEGPHNISLIAWDSSLWKNKIAFIISFFVDRTPPALGLKRLKEVVEQGTTACFFILSDEKLKELRAEVANKEFKAFPLGENGKAYRLLFPVSVFASVKDYSFVIYGTDLAGNRAELKTSFRVKGGFFEQEIIEVPKAKEGIFTKIKEIQDDTARIKQALADLSPLQFWGGSFILPAIGVVSSPFGIRRVYTTGSIVSYHRGIDIANKEGTVVVAANRGRVILAEELVLYGNTVILDHGQGLISWYCHLERIAVKLGQVLAKGELIGLMGSTGLATGPHLHWEMQLAGMEINPLEWLKEDFVLEDLY